MLKLLFNQVRLCSTVVSKNIGVIGVPFSGGQGKVGVNDGPKFLRAAGLIDDLKSISHSLNIKDYGDIKYHIPSENWVRSVENMSKLEHVAACNQELSKTVQNILKDGRVCFTLGGDHSIAIGSIDGSIKHHKEISLIWVDAHTDMNTNATSGSGNIHGMPLALLIKEFENYWPYIPYMDWQKPTLSIKNIAIIGARSVDFYEKKFIQKHGIKVFGMREIELLGIKEVMNMAMNFIDPFNNRPLHLSFDIDGLDPFEAPSTGTPVRGGLTLREGIYIMEEAFNTGRLSNVDMVEVNPKIGTEMDVKKTLESAKLLICAAAGNQRISNYKFDDAEKN